MSVASAEGIATLQSLCQGSGCPYHDELCSTTCCVALVVFWMGLHQEKFPLLAGDFITSCCWSRWSPKVGTDSPEQCQSVVGYLHRCDCCTLP